MNASLMHGNRQGIEAGPGRGGGTYLGDMEMRGGVEDGMRGGYLGRGER